MVIFYESMHNARIIPLDGSPHLPSNVRLWDGDSRGHWEGNTLVVDWKNFDPRQEFQGAMQGSSQPLIVARIDSGPGAVGVTEAVAGSGGFSYIYTVVFKSPTLSGAQPSIVAAASNTQMTVRVSTVADGGASAVVTDGATIQFDGAAGSISAPTGVLTLNAATTTPAGSFGVPGNYYYVITSLSAAGVKDLRVDDGLT